MSREHIYQTLLLEPYNLSFAEIAELTDYQIHNILFRDRKSTWNPPADPDTSVMEVEETELRQQFFETYRAMGHKDEEIEKWFLEMFPELGEDGN